MKDNFIIRKCTINDAEAISVISSATFIETFSDSGISGGDILAHCTGSHSLQFYESILSHSESFLWLAINSRNSCPIGYMHLIISEGTGEAGQVCIELRRLYVLGRFQRRGLGRLFLAEMREFSDRSGAGFVNLYVYESNRIAIKFYQRNGFIITKSLAYHLGGKSYPALEMISCLIPDQGLGH